MRFNEKTWIYSIAVISLAVIVYSISLLNQYYYPVLNTKSVKLLILDKPHIVKNENVFYSIIGLNAPKEVTNIHSYGVELIQQALDKSLDEDMKHLDMDVYLRNDSNAMSLNIDETKLICWLGRTSVVSGEKCYTSDELKEVVEDNHILLERIVQMLSYEQYSLVTPFHRNGQLLMSMYKLYVANTRNILLTDTDSAINSLIAGLRFSRKMIGQTGNWIEKAIWLVIYGLSLNQLEYVLINHPDIAVKYESIITTELADLLLEELNVTSVYQKEFENLNYIFCIDQQLGIDTNDYCQNEFELDDFSASFMMNDFYERYVVNQDTLTLDFEELVEHCDEDHEYSSFNMVVDMILHFPILVEYSTYNLFVQGMVKGCRMVENFKIKGAKIRQMKVYLDIKAKGIDEGGIKTYLENHELRDVISGYSFVYDKKNKSLMFPVDAPEAVTKLKLGMKL